MTVVTFIQTGEACGLCGHKILTQSDNPVVLDIPGYGERVYHADCLGPDVMEQVKANQEEMRRARSWS